MGGLCSSCYRLLIGRPSEYETIASNTPASKAVMAVAREEKPYAPYQLSNPTNAVHAIQAQAQPVSMTTRAVGAATMKSGFLIEYELRDEIGVGSTSKCYRCYRKSDGNQFAVKVIDKRQIDPKFSGLLDQFYVEIQVLRLLNHPNIIKLEETFETPDRLYVVMEMMTGGELFEYVVEKGTLNEEEASVMIRKITSAVAHMHSLNIIHRDLKPENLLLTSKGPEAEVKLIDFGLAKEMSDPVTRSFLGTRGYLAPEMLQRHNYDKAVDIWALGVIAFVLLCGCLPFTDDSSKIPNEHVARKKFTLRFPRWASSLSASAKDLLHNLLDVNPKTRYTAEQALSHPWVIGRTVMPNSYLQSPSMLAGERRKELRSPMTPSMQAMQQRIAEQAAATKVPSIAEERDKKRPDMQGRTNGRQRPQSFAGDGKPPRRQNSF